MNLLTHFFEAAINFMSSPKAMDHLIFTVVFALVFQFREWKSILMLFLAIWVGYSTTLFLGGFHILHFSTSTTQLLLALSIAVVAVTNLMHRSQSSPSVIRYNTTVILGLMQGVGYSHTLTTLKSSPKLIELIGFDLGLMVMGMAIILITIVTTSLLLLIFRSDRRDFNMVCSGIGIGISLILLWIRW